MLDEKSLKTSTETMNIVTAIMAIVSFVGLMFSLLGFNPVQHFLLGLIMMATVIVYAVSATIRTVFESPAAMTWFLMGCWIATMTGQFASAAIR